MMQGLGFLKEYGKHESEYLPLIDHAGKVFPGRDPKHGEVNIGWNCGLVDGNRPYFAELWAVDGITVLTIFISQIGLETQRPGQIDRMLDDAGLYRMLPGTRRPAVVPFTDQSGNSFYSVNVIVGDEVMTYAERTLGILPFSLLNKYNESTMNQGE